MYLLDGRFHQVPHLGFLIRTLTCEFRVSRSNRIKHLRLDVEVRFGSTNDPECVRKMGFVVGHFMAQEIDADSVNVIEDDEPSNILRSPNRAGNDGYTRRCKAEGVAVHPARFPSVLPKTFIRFLTDHEDLVLDPFAGSNTTGMVADELERRWLAIEVDADYVTASRLRFNNLRWHND